MLKFKRKKKIGADGKPCDCMLEVMAIYDGFGRKLAESSPQAVGRPIVMEYDGLLYASIGRGMFFVSVKDYNGSPLAYGKAVAVGNLVDVYSEDGDYLKTGYVEGSIGSVCTVCGERVDVDQLMPASEANARKFIKHIKDLENGKLD
jgi:hypothetical protein